MYDELLCTDSVNDGLMRDFMYVLLAKVNHCYADKDYPTIKTLLAYIQVRYFQIKIDLNCTKLVPYSICS